MSSPPKITIRPPLTTSPPAPQPPAETYSPPPLPWLLETWNVTHSTLPMWKSKRNVQIQYTSLAPSDPSVTAEGGESDRLDDLVTYQGLDSSKVSSVRGVDKAANAQRRDVWDWRGRGWLVVAGSRWEVIGWGEEEEEGGGGGDHAPTGSSPPGGGGTNKNKWVVTLFAKTLFTPQGVDIYSLSPQGVKAETLQGIKKALAGCEDGSVKKLAGELFEVAVDGERAG
ncbi:hypothetical protein K431DRAFT_281314 [Polychaeton citri CBS 116435]|uniref:Uncharacterized protein n=1 Tax=Polychaeton citri CBS 116435 TaxID=1314669 RepID=A0A9P4QI89_9PEZI|nr:hypothetical protein K431DRAFT_281314 [Polychaeton citri CBS 116435]